MKKKTNNETPSIQDARPRLPTKRRGRAYHTTATLNDQ